METLPFAATLLLLSVKVKLYSPRVLYTIDTTVGACAFKPVKYLAESIAFNTQPATGNMIVSILSISSSILY